MLKILLIDDEPDSIESMRIVLTAEGFWTETAQSPQEGIQKVKETNPDLVVLDVMMPSDYEGFEVARHIRENLKMDTLPIVILSNVHHVKKVPYRFAPDKDFLPVDVFLDKPVKPEMLLDTVNRLLGQKRENPKTPL